VLTGPITRQLAETIDVGNPSGPTVVIAPGDNRCTSSGCGTGPRSAERSRSPGEAEDARGDGTRGSARA